MDQTERRNEMLLHLCAAYLLTQGYSPTGPQQDAEALRARFRVLRTLMPRKRVIPSHAVSNAPSAL